MTSSEDEDEYLSSNAFRNWTNNPRVFITWQDNSSDSTPHIIVRRVEVTNTGTPSYTNEVQIDLPSGETTFEIQSCSGNYFTVKSPTTGDVSIYKYSDNGKDSTHTGDADHHNAFFIDENIFVRSYLSSSGDDVIFSWTNLSNSETTELKDSDNDLFEFSKTNTYTYSLGDNSVIVTDETEAQFYMI